MKSKILEVIGMQKKIYLVKDEKNLNALLTRYLQREGDEVKTFANRKFALEEIIEMPDLWILNIMLTMKI